MSAAPAIVALDEALPTAGAIVYWRLSGDVDPAELGHVWRRAGLDPAWLPLPPQPKVALSRVMREQAGRRTMARPLEARAGHALVDERATGTDLSYSVGLVVRLDEVHRIVCDPPDHKLAPVLRAAYDRALELCTASDIGSWLADIVRRLDGLAMRDHGGIYYIPPAQVDTWRAVVGCLRTVSAHHVFEVPAMRSSEAVAAVLDALDQEATAEVEKAAADLESGELGERALESRARKLAALEAKMQRYEALLGGGLEALRLRLVAVQGNIVAAALALAPAVDIEDAP